MENNFKVYPPGAGDVTIQLGNRTLILKPTLAAGLTVSRQSGGIRGAINKIVDMDLDTIMSVIRIGVGPKEAKKLGDLEQLIFENGLMDSQGALLAKLVEYLTNIARGGRPADDEETMEGKDIVDPPRPSA